MPGRAIWAAAAVAAVALSGCGSLIAGDRAAVVVGLAWVREQRSASESAGCAARVLSIDYPPASLACVDGTVTAGVGWTRAVIIDVFEFDPRGAAQVIAWVRGLPDLAADPSVREGHDTPFPAACDEVRSEHSGAVIGVGAYLPPEDSKAVVRLRRDAIVGCTVGTGRATGASFGFADRRWAAGAAVGSSVAVAVTEDWSELDILETREPAGR